MGCQLHAMSNFRGGEKLKLAVAMTITVCVAVFVLSYKHDQALADHEILAEQVATTDPYFRDLAGGFDPKVKLQESGPSRTTPRIPPWTKTTSWRRRALPLPSWMLSPRKRRRSCAVCRVGKPARICVITPTRSARRRARSSSDTAAKSLRWNSSKKTSINNHFKQINYKWAIVSDSGDKLPTHCQCSQCKKSHTEFYRMIMICPFNKGAFR